MTARSGFLTSLRGRLIVVLVLGLGAAAIAVVALSFLARTSRDQRVARAKEHVETELERLIDLAPTLTFTQRSGRGRRGELRSGFVDVPEAADNARVASLVRQATAPGQTVFDEGVAADGMPIVAGAVALPGGGYVWALQRVIVGPEARSLRVAVLCLTVAMLAMVVASVQTLIVFDRGVGSLRASVLALGRDLGSTVPRPRVRELAEVAAGLDSLAQDLMRAEADKVKLLEELAEHERWAALGRVVAGVAHEVRNPLAAIKLRTDLAETSAEVPPPLREDFALIGSEVARLDRLVRDLLLLADQRPVVRSRVDVAGLVAQRTALLRPWALEHGVTLETSGAASALLDQDAVTRAIDNLLRNAIEASPAGSAVLVQVSAADAKVEVRVSDAGPGVPPERVGLLFEPFFTTKPTGTGLGLALSRSVALAHGGTLHHARRDGRTEFTLEVAKG